MKDISKVMILLLGIMLMLNHPIRAQGAVTDQVDRQISFEIKEGSNEKTNETTNHSKEASDSNRTAAPKGKTYSEKEYRTLPKTGEQNSLYQLTGLILLFFSLVGIRLLGKKGCYEKTQK